MNTLPPLLTEAPSASASPSPSPVGSENNGTDANMDISSKSAGVSETLALGPAFGSSALLVLAVIFTVRCRRHRTWRRILGFQQNTTTATEPNAENIQPDSTRPLLWDTYLDLDLDLEMEKEKEEENFYRWRDLKPVSATCALTAFMPTSGDDHPSSSSSSSASHSPSHPRQAPDPRLRARLRHRLNVAVLIAMPSPSPPPPPSPPSPPPSPSPPPPPPPPPLPPTPFTSKQRPPESFDLDCYFSYGLERIETEEAETRCGLIQAPAQRSERGWRCNPSLSLALGITDVDLDVGVGAYVPNVNTSLN